MEVHGMLKHVCSYCFMQRLSHGSLDSLGLYIRHYLLFDWQQNVAKITHAIIFELPNHPTMPCQQVGADSCLCKSPLTRTFPRAAQYVCVDIHFWMQQHFNESAEAPSTWLPDEAGSRSMSRLTAGTFQLVDDMLNGIVNWMMGKQWAGFRRTAADIE